MSNVSLPRSIECIHLEGPGKLLCVYVCLHCVGVAPGTVVVTNKSFNAFLEEKHEVVRSEGKWVGQKVEGRGSGCGRGGQYSASSIIRTAWCQTKTQVFG